MLRALMGSRRSAFESWRARRAALVCCVVVPLVGACGRSSLLDEYVQARDAGQPLDGAALVDARPAADLALIGDLALVDLAMPGVGDLAVWADFATPPLADLSARPDFTSTPDLRASSDLAGRADLAASPDLSTVADLASRPDLSAPPDLAVVPDFAMPQDLALPPDLTTPPDLTMPPDLFVSPAGCADGTREGFLDTTRFPDIAACAGHFPKQSLRASRSGMPCDPGTNTCASAADLCRVGWHICMANGSAHDLADRVSSADCGSAVGGMGIFVTAADHAVVECAGPCSYAPTPLLCSDHPPVACGLGSFAPDYCCPDQVWPKATPSTNQAWGANRCDLFDQNAKNREGNGSLGVLCCRDPEIPG